MVDEDYEIVSHKEIASLKQEIRKLKEAEFSGSANTIMNKLDKILDIFREASSSLKNEKSSNQELSEKLEKVMEQNQKIAEGLLAVADLVKSSEKEQPKQAPPMPKPELNHPPFPGQASHFPPHRPGQTPPPMPRQAPSPFPKQAPMPRPLNQHNFGNEFPKPGMPSLNPLEQSGKTPMHGLPPLPPKPHKKGLFR